MERFTADLTPQQLLHRPCEGGNCTAWIVGHTALTLRGVIEKLGQTPPALPEGFEQRFSRQNDAPQQSDFGDTSIILPLFQQHIEALIAAVEQADDAALAAPTPKPHPMFASLGQLVSFMAAHSNMHAGQITVIRRSMGLPPIV